MPSTATITGIPPINQLELNAIPEWARTEYRNQQGVLAQITQRFIKLEATTKDLKAMQQAGTCPRSIRVNVTISVAEAQQQAMDEALTAAKNAFEIAMLDALIKAREAELGILQAQGDAKCAEFKTFLETNFQKLLQSNVRLPEHDADVGMSIQLAENEFRKRAEDVTAKLHIQHFFQRQREESRRKKRELAEQERRINEELADPQVKQLQQRITSLERKLLPRPAAKQQRRQREQPKQQRQQRQNQNRSNTREHQPQRNQQQRRGKQHDPRTNNGNTNRQQRNKSRAPFRERGRRRTTPV